MKLNAYTKRPGLTRSHTGLLRSYLCQFQIITSAKVPKVRWSECTFLVCACVQGCLFMVHVWRRSEVKVRCCSSGCCSHRFGDSLLPSWPVGSQGCSPPQNWEDKGVPLNMAFAVGSGGLNSGPLACEASIFTLWAPTPCSRTHFSYDGSWLEAAFISRLGWVWVKGNLEA